MKAPIKNIVKFLVVVAVCLFKRCTGDDLNFVEMLEKLDAMEEEFEQWYSQKDTEPWALNDYESEDRRGIREELIVNDIEIHDDPELSKGIENWQVLQHESGIYLAGRRASTIFFYYLDSQSNQLLLRANISVPEKIRTFKLIKLFDNIDIPSRYNNIHIILSLEGNEGIYNLKWFCYLNDLRVFQEHWKWDLDKAVQNIEYFNSLAHYKLLLIYESTTYFKKTYSQAEVYEIDLTENSMKFRLCYQFSILDNYRIQLCPTQGDREIISFLSKNEVSLLELKDEKIVGCTFEQFQAINIYEVVNSICFESGYSHYLITLGHSSNFFKFHTHEFVHDEKMEKFLQGIGNINGIQSLPVNTYRDEVILFIQMENSSVLALGWMGSEFKMISLPNEKLDRFDLSKATVIPKVGLLVESSIIKLEVSLNLLPEPVENEIELMLKNKLILEEILEEQEMIINKTNLLIEQSKTSNDEIQELKNFSEVEIDSLEVSNIDFPVILGSQNLTLRNLESDYSSAIGLINSLEAKVGEIENNLKNAIMRDIDIDFQEIDIDGNLEIKGTLHVENLKIDHLNEVSMDALMNECQRSNNGTISGVKSFPTIELMPERYKIVNLNGKSINSFQYDEFDDIYTKIDLSKVNRLELNSLNVSYVSGENWENLMKKLVFKSKSITIPGTTNISGQVLTDVVLMKYLNDIKYPDDYIVKASPNVADMTDAKTFQTLRVSDLQDVKTINDIDADEFIILNADQSLQKQITFENLVIDEGFQVDGKIVGFGDIDPDLTLLNSNTIQSNAMITNLIVTGKVYVENSVDGISWTELDDVILKDEEKVVITGTQTFLNSVHFSEDLEIKSKMINQHKEQDFVTLNTRQVLPNLLEISGNVKFSEVTYEDLKNFEDEIVSNIDESGMPVCMEKSLIFFEPPIIDSLSSLYFNYDIDGMKFSEKLESLSENAYFEHLKVKKLIVDDVVPTNVNGINFREFENQKISRSGYQNLSGNITIKYLETKSLYADLINNHSSTDFENAIEKVNELYLDVFNGSVSIDSLYVTGTVVTSAINGQDLNEVCGVNYIERLIFGANKTIENIEVDGLINNLNFTSRVKDTVLKTEDSVIIKGPKRIKKLTTTNLQVDNINGHSVNDIVSIHKNQTLIGPVRIKGSVNVEKLFNCSGEINNLPFKNISEIIYKLDDKVYKLNGDFVFNGNPLIRDLNVFGKVQDEEITEFMENLIYLHDKRVTVTGTKIFNNSVNFDDGVLIANNLNEIDLKTFYESAVLITDQAISLQSKIVFENDVLLENDLAVENNLKVNTIKDININDLMENAVYINRPTSFIEGVVFSNVVFKSDITVESWNNVKMDTLFTLNKDEIIRDILICDEVSTDNLEIKGFVNSENLTDFVENTFMLSKDQHVTGKMSFLNNVHVHSDFNTRYINNVDISKAILLNDDNPLTGNFVFKSPVTINGSLQVLGNLNDIDFTKWKSKVVTSYQPFTEQVITGDWIIHGNVTFEQNVLGSGLINDIRIKELANTIEKQNKDIGISVSNKMKDLKNTCENLQAALSKADNMLYKFKSFEYLAVLEFPHAIASVHHFDFNEVDYIMINFETCQMRVLSYTNEGFVKSADVPNFGYVKQYITLKYENTLYFITIGVFGCGRNSGNLWSLENNQFKHILDFGNVTDAKKLGNDGFAIVVDYEFQEWDIKNIHEKSFEPINVISIREKNVQFFSNERDTLLASRDTIYGFPLEERASNSNMEFEEYDNHFGTNELVTFQVGIHQKEYILFYDNRISSNYFFICSNDLTQRKVLQSINTHRPNSFFVLNFDGFEESLLIFTENRRKLKIYNYMGIEGFKYHSNIKIKVDMLFNFKLRKHPYLAKKHCLGVIQDKKLAILEATTYGEKLDIGGELVCELADLQ